MLTVGITGVEGLIGWHLRCFLGDVPNVRVIGANRRTFDSAHLLDRFVREADVVVHLAGINRGGDDDISRGNVALVEALCRACLRCDRKPDIVFSSSTQVDHNTVYGAAKRRCAEILYSWAEQVGASFTNLILPHIFGECGRPFYNSVVATFCHQLATGEEPRVLEDRALELKHAQRLAEEIWQAIKARHGDERRIRGAPLGVAELLERLKQLDYCYRRQVIPDLAGDLELDLFNTYRSYLFPDHYPVDIFPHIDQRGRLVEIVKANSGGQCFSSITAPGVSRGNHYHRRKFERFVVVGGSGLIQVRRLFDSKIISFEVNGEKPQYVDIPTLHTHSLTNSGSGDLMTLFWANEVFDPSEPDTYSQPVVE